MGHIIDTAEAISKYLRKNQLVIIESSTYPGTTNELIRPILEKSGLMCHEDFYLAYSPEREDPGNKKFDISSIPKVVGADSTKSLEIALEIYSKLTKTFAMNSSYEAEAVKLTENIFRSVNIALVNELKIIYDHMGIDTWNVIDGAATKPFGFMPFYPGPGIGGHCIPVDPFYLTFKAREHSLATKFIELAGDINSSMPPYIVNKCQDHLNNASKALHGSNVLICGVAYKKNIDDLRESPCLEIMDLLQKKGANLYFNDPLIKNIPSTRKFKNLTEIRSLEISPESLKKIDLVLICTDHDSFDYDCLINNSKRVIDTRSCLPKESYNEYIVKA
jgi:UDP-N-acetyl-D-glucosamine dehydrogenase